MATPIYVSGIKIDEVGVRNTVESKNTESLAQLAKEHFCKGMVAGVVGQIIPNPAPGSQKREMPNTKANMARLHGNPSPHAIDLSAKKSDVLVSSCWGGGGFTHPMDFHYHPPDHPAQQKPGTVMYV